MAPTQLKTLQIGRGIAALAVCAYHLSVLMERHGDSTFTVWAERGFLGVDFFFVLSGFIILHAHRKDLGRPAQVGAYAYKRFARVYPIYWIYTAVLVAALYVGIGSGEWIPRTAADWFKTVTLVRITPGETPLFVAWTLFHEIVFYAVFAVMILNLRAGLALLAVWFVGICAYHTYPELTPIGSVLGLYNLNFLIGMMAFLAAPKLGPRAAPAVGLAGLVLFAATYAANPDLHGPGRLLYAAAFGLILAGAVGVERRRPVNAPLLSLLGDASYTIYLTHELILTAGYRVVARFVQPPAVVLYPALFVGTAAAGVMLYLCLEKPLLNRMRRRRPSPAEPAAMKAAV
jgi:peptidoglycan/LPS O-acetylase OafA/YrhL